MKRSTLLFISANLVILLIPAFLMLGLRMKIAAGDITDLKAQREAEFKVDNNIGPIESIIVKSRYRGLSLRLEMDTVDKITIDTASVKYIHYQLTKGVLTIEYDFEKDSIENSPLFDIDEETGEVDPYVNTNRWITVNTTSSVKKYDMKESSLELLLSDENLIRNDLEIVSVNSAVNFLNPSSDEMDFSAEWARINSLPYRVKLTMDNSELDMDLEYVKELELDFRNTEVTNFVDKFGFMDIKIDRRFPLAIDVTEWDKIKLKYNE